MMPGQIDLPGLSPVPYHSPQTPQDRWAEIDACLDRIDHREETIKALVPYESAKARRERLTTEYKAVKDGPLAGLLIGVKDLFHTSQFPTRGGSSLPAEAFLRPGAPGRPDNEPVPSEPTDTSDGATDYDATVVQRLRENGALILGKTVSTEFAYFGPGPTANPINPTHTPGGSSSGSAAAVAAGYCNAALGSQTIGSITRPASFCGVVGYKPSFGRIPSDGSIPFSRSVDHVGVIAADVTTATTVASVLVDRWERSAVDTRHAEDAINEARRAKDALQGVSAVPPGLRDLLHSEIGTVLIPDDAYVEQADDTSIAALNAAAERLTGLGVEVQRVSVFDDIEEINAAHQSLIAYDFADVHKFWIDEFRDLYHPRSIELLERGLQVETEVVERGRDGRLSLRDRLDSTLRRHGAALWIAPATVGEAPKGLETTGNAIMNLPWTYAGVPTVGLPLYRLPHGVGPAGLPLGLQIAGEYDRDERLLYLATLIEASFM